MEQTEGKVCWQGTQPDASAPEVIKRGKGSSNTVQKFTQRPGEPEETMEERLAKVNYKKLTERHEPYWHEYSTHREDRTTNEYINWYSKLH